MGNAVYPRYKAWKANGVAPAAGYYLYTYVSNSTVPKATYSDANFDVAHANPIVLDANGEAAIFLLPGDYRFDLKTPTGALINTFDPVNSSSSGGGGSGTIATVDSIAALRLLTPPAIATTYQVLGYYAVGDFGGGSFYFNTLSGATDDGGFVIRPSTNPTLGRWIRLNDRPISVKFWGWVGSGAPVDATAIAAMLAYTTALVNPDYYHVPGELTVYNKVTIKEGVDSSSIEQISTDLTIATSGTGHVVLAPGGVAALTTTLSVVTSALLHTMSLGLTIGGADGGAPDAQGTFIKATVYGLSVRGITGSSYDLTLWNAGGTLPLIRNPTGTNKLEMYGQTAIGNTAGAGITAPNGIALSVQNDSLSGVAQASITAYSVLSASATTIGLGMDIQLITVDSSFTMVDGVGLRIQAPSKGASNTITNLYGIKVENQGVGTNNFALTTGTGVVSIGDILKLIASSTARATLNIPSGTAPTSPVSGDMWYNGTNLMFRDGGTTRTITWV